MDGLKISLRKILYAAFKKNLTNEIKVAQFSGYVSEQSCYHHGEASLNQAIKGMAQNYVGSNNINLLVPSGQFGTRLQGGNDSASERYIFTYLNKVTRLIFPQKDDLILKYLDDDGIPVEPIFYAPIIPMVLVNGTKGIGTGFSTDIMCYRPKEIIEYLKAKLLSTSSSMKDFLPYYQGFTGTIEKIEESANATSVKKFLIKGKYLKLANDKIRVTELPVGHWTDDFKEHLEKLIEPGLDKEGKKIATVIKDYDDLSKDTTVDFIVYFQKGKLEELEQVKGDYNCNGVEKLLKLYTTSSTSNMHLFDANDKLKKYATVEQIIDDYYTVRLDLYQKRKDYMIAELQKELVLLSNKTKFIQENLDGTIDLRKKKREEVVAILNSKKYSVLDEDAEYKYLTKMPMDSVTEEHVDKMNKDCNNKKMELDEIVKTTIHNMWLQELDYLYKVL
jgi:DNA topoisomerase-2